MQIPEKSPGQIYAFCEPAPQKRVMGLAVDAATLKALEYCFLPTRQRAMLALGIGDDRSHAHRKYRQAYPKGYQLHWISDPRNDPRLLPWWAQAQGAQDDRRKEIDQYREAAWPLDSESGGVQGQTNQTSNPAPDRPVVEERISSKDPAHKVLPQDRDTDWGLGGPQQTGAGRDKSDDAGGAGVGGGDVESASGSDEQNQAPVTETRRDDEKPRRGDRDTDKQGVQIGGGDESEEPPSKDSARRDAPAGDLDGFF